MIDLNYLYCFSNLCDEEDEVTIFDYLSAQALVKVRNQNFSRYYEGVIAERICYAVDEINAPITSQDKFILLLNEMGGNVHDFIYALKAHQPNKTNVIDRLFYKLEPNSRIFSAFNELRSRGNLVFFEDVKSKGQNVQYEQASDEEYLFTKPLKMFGFRFLVDTLKDLQVFNLEDDKFTKLSDEQIVTLCLPLFEEPSLNVLKQELPMFSIECLENGFEKFKNIEKDEDYLLRMRTQLYKDEYNSYFVNLWYESYHFADGLINIDIDGYEYVDFGVEGSEIIPYSQYVLDMQQKMKIASKSKKQKDLNMVTRFNATKEQCDNFCQEIVGQEDAKNLIVDKLMSVSCGFYTKGKPIATFLLNGTTGVGKTQTAKSLAKYFFDDKIYTIDMTNFKHESDMSILTGSPPGYVGYNDKNAFIEYVKANPKCVILFDEIDKANPSVLPFMMRLLDEGKFSTAKGETIDVKNCVIIATTNQKANISTNSANRNLEELSAHSGERGSPFLKEFMGRFDEILDYEPLSNEDLKQILCQKLDKRIKEFEEQNVTGIRIGYGDELLDDIITFANSKVTGARALHSGIQQLFIRPLSRYILENKAYGANIVVKNKDYLLVDEEEISTKQKPKSSEKKATYENELNYFG